MDTPDAGLCGDCLNSRRVGSARGSVFHRCLLHERDARFPKYPRLPVLQCSGYAENPGRPPETGGV